MRKVFLVAFATVAVQTVTLPQPSFAGGGPRDHLGFFLRMTAGGLYASTSADDWEFVDILGEVDASGWGGDFTLAIGGCVSENFALHGSLFSGTVTDPDVEIENLGEGELDGSVTLNAYGGGVTYFIMPANVYLSGNIGLAFVTIDAEGEDHTTDPGIALDLSLGKEWWVGNSWGLGLAGAFGFHSVEDFSGWNVGVRFSATFN